MPPRQIPNSSSFAEYQLECAVCGAGGHEGDDDATFGVIVFISVGWVMVALQSLVQAGLGNRMSKLLVLSGAKKASHIPVLLTTMTTEFATMSADGVRHSERTDLTDSDHMLHFDDAKKDANDVMTWRSYRAFMFVTKLAQLFICFHFGFYICHMSMSEYIACAHL